VFTKTASGVPFDGNGNVIGLVNAADGTLAAEYEYTPTGVVIKAIGVAANACPLGFMTRYTDSETGLVCDHHRYLDVVNDRFLNHDPIEERGGLNLYAINGNDSVNRIDPFGLDGGAPVLDPSGKGSVWRDPTTGQFTNAPQLPAPPGSDSVLNLPSSRDAGNSVGGYGKAVIEVAKRLPKAILDAMLKHGQSECQKQQTYSGGGCACCVVRVYKITSISATLGNQDTYVYGFARVVKDGCDKVKKTWEDSPEIVPLYAPHDTEMQRYFNVQTTMNQYYPW
jgi:RHS repeat-associated protein